MNTVVKRIYINLMIIYFVEAMNSMLAMSLAKAFSRFSLTMASSITSSKEVRLFTFSFFSSLCFFLLKFKFGLLFGTIHLNYDASIFN